MGFDLAAVRADFPILGRKIRTLDGADRPLIYMDHGASTHAPRPVIETVTSVLSDSYANIHRGNHTLSLESSQQFDDAVVSFLRFVGANPETHCAVLGQNTTMALDLAAHVMAETPGATLTTLLEHHSNDLPHRKRGKVLHADVDAQGRLLLDDVQRQLEENKIKLLAVSGASNVTGYTPPIHKLARMAHDDGARILVDAAQLYAHKPIDVKPDDHAEHIDFIAAAGHKAYAPLGSGFLIGPRDLFDAAPPYMPGGGTVQWVATDNVGFAKSPDRHMGGTPNIVGAIAFGAATAYLSRLGMDKVRKHEEQLVKAGLKRFKELETHGVRLLGPTKASEKVGVFSFLVPGVRHELVSAILNHEHAIATRNGCFCAQPLVSKLLGIGSMGQFASAMARGEAVDLPGATRATLGIYNSEAELDALVEAVRAIAKGQWKGRYDMVGHGECSPRETPVVLS